MKSRKGSFHNSRARLQRLKDAKFFSGWVKSFEDAEIHVQLPANVALELHDDFLLEIYGQELTAWAQGHLGMVSEGIGVFTTLQPIRYGNSKEPVRVRVEGVTGVISTSDPDNEAYSPGCDAEIVDVSHEGAGLFCQMKIDRGSKVRLVIDTPAGPVDCRGEARYCKSEADRPGLFRVGVKLEPMGRLETARWAKMIEISSEAA